MPANTTPIFPVAPNNPVSPKVLTANTALDGTGTTVLIFTAGANGALIESIRIVPLGANAATVVRIFKNNGSDPSVAANNGLYLEARFLVSSLSQTQEGLSRTIPVNKAINAGHKLYASVGTGVSAGFIIHVEAGDY